MVDVAGRVVAFLAVAVFVVSFFIDEPLRRYIEQQFNTQLQGFTVRIDALDFHSFSLSGDLNDVVIVQDGHPDPPVVCVPELNASTQWRALGFFPPQQQRASLHSVPSLAGKSARE
jgi:hypothetical protein